MIIKATLFSLIVLLVLIVAASYYVNKEGFEAITDAAALANAINTVSSTPEINQPQQQLTEENITAQQTVTADSTIPQREDVTPEISISGSGYDAMSLKQRMDLLKDIQKVVRNEIIAGRNTQPILSGETRKDKITDATAQGQEYEGSCYKDTEYRCPKNPDGSCPPIPDMTQYIKKDAIPCWGCSLDY